jgi:hypothetical protein
MHRQVGVGMGSLLVLALSAPADSQGGAPAGKSPGAKILESRVAGSWYPADPSALRRLFDGYLDQAGVSPPKARPLGLISPHAGYRYSGAAAAHGFKAVKGMGYQRVLVLGPSHYGAFSGISVAEADFIATPLGRIPVDGDAAAMLRRHPLFGTVPAAHDREHSIEMQLPFLQHVLGPFAVIEMAVGRLEASQVAEAASAIRPLLDERSLLVASSDFTHYGPQFGYVPFRDNLPKRLEELDLGAYRFIEAGDVQGFLNYVERTGATICGRLPIAIAMAALAPVKAVLLHYDTSGRQLGDYRNSVSYLSALLTR